MSTYYLQTEIDISATPERVWSILTDFSSYPDWNPFIRSIRGTPEQGFRLTVRMQPHGAKSMTFHPTVLTAARARELCWLGHLLIPGLFDGEHRFTIKPITNDTVRFIQSELFRGILIPVFRTRLDRGIKKDFDEMNRALKARVEAGTAGSQE